MLCLERVNVSLRDSEVLELNEGIAGDSGDEEEKSEEQSPVTSVMGRSGRADIARERLSDRRITGKQTIEMDC